MWKIQCQLTPQVLEYLNYVVVRIIMHIISLAMKTIDSEFLLPLFMDFLVHELRMYMINLRMQIIELEYV